VVELRRILCPMDLSDHAAWVGRARTLACRLVQRRPARHARDAVRTDCTVETTMRDGTPYREILRVAGEREADLIVLGVHGRNAADLLFFGSTTNHVIREAEFPVLTVGC